MAIKHSITRRPHKGTARPQTADEFERPEPGPGTLGITREAAQRHYVHVRECTERLAQKLAADDTPTLVRIVLERYLSDLGSEYFRRPQVVRAAFEAVCLEISRPPFPPPLVSNTGEVVGQLEELLNLDTQRSLAEARRMQRRGFLSRT